MKKDHIFIGATLAALILGCGTLADCTQADQQKAQGAACAAQALANAATASGQAVGDAKLAAAGSVASVALGALCTGLPGDTPLTVQPLPVNSL